jgi:Tol biopolymer transport system component
MIGRRGLLAWAGAVAVAGMVGTAMAQSSPAPRPAGAGTVARAGFAEPSVVGALPSVSDDGRWIVFEGEPTDGSDRSRTVWLRDASTPEASPVELSPVRDEVRPGASVRPTISGDGCVVAFVSEMPYDLFRDDDTGERWDVYRVVLPHCEGGDLTDVELVSTRSSADGDTSGLDRVWPDDAPALSQSGSVVAFTHAAGPDDALLEVSVVDLQAPIGNPLRVNRVAGTPPEPPTTTFRYTGQREPDLSDDGRFVAFTSDARSDAPVPAWADGPVDGGPATSQVFVWDRFANGSDAPVQLVSALDGEPASWGAAAPAISGNGQFVAFESVSPELAGEAQLPDCTGPCPAQVYRVDQADASVVLVSRENTDSPDERLVAADQGASQPTITDDGTQVGFVTRSRNLFLTVAPAGAATADGDIAVSEVDRGIVRRVSTTADGVTPAPGGNSHPQLSGSGHVIVFDSVNADRIAGAGAVAAPAASMAGRHVVSVARPARLDVPSLDVGTVAVLLPGPEWYVPVRNEGPSTFLPAVVESSSSEFTITGGTCELAVPVPPGESCTVKVVLTPADLGPRSAELTVSEALFGGTSVTSPLLGQGGEPTLFPSFSGLDFPATAVGVESITLSSDIRNIGFGPARIIGFAVTGDHPEDFRVVAESCTERLVNAGSQCSFDVVFTPTEAGHRTATVSAFTEFGQYTAVLVNGDGFRDAELAVAEREVRAGDDVFFGGAGFRPFAEVTVSWADGRGASVTVTAGADGTFMARMPTRVLETVGDRVLVGQSGDQLARAEVRVLRNPRAAERLTGD